MEAVVAPLYNSIHLLIVLGLTDVPDATDDGGGVLALENFDQAAVRRELNQTNVYLEKLRLELTADIHAAK